MQRVDRNDSQVPGDEAEGVLVKFGCYPPLQIAGSSANPEGEIAGHRVYVKPGEFCDRDEVQGVCIRPQGPSRCRF